MPGEPRTGRGRASRERIVEGAAELFAERGVAATSLDEVLAAAGAGKGRPVNSSPMRAEAASTADMAASSGWYRPPRPMKSRYAPVVTWNPGGTWNPARARRASEAEEKKLAAQSAAKYRRES